MLLKAVLLTTLLVAVCYDAVLGAGFTTQFHMCRTDQDLLGKVWELKEKVVVVIVTNYDPPTENVNKIMTFFTGKATDVIVLYMGDAECACAEKYFHSDNTHPYTVVINENKLHHTVVHGYDETRLLSMFSKGRDFPRYLNYYSFVTKDLVAMIDSTKPWLNERLQAAWYREVRAAAKREQQNQMEQTHGLSLADKAGWPNLENSRFLAGSSTQTAAAGGSQQPQIQLQYYNNTKKSKAAFQERRDSTRKRSRNSSEDKHGRDNQ